MTGRPEKVVRICKTCEQEFTVFPYLLRQGNGKFCSRLCAGVARQQPITLLCETCGREFSVSPDRARKGRRFCSHHCWAQPRKRGKIVPCQTCGEEFYLTQARVKRGSKYCSRHCHAQAQKQQIPRHKGKHRPDAERFWAFVQKLSSPSECWLWTGSKGRGGYGQFTPYGRNAQRAHRFAWELTQGPIPEGLYVLHNCPGDDGDRPDCVNPAHLWLGTARDNIRDAARKGRLRTGASHPRPGAKLTEQDVRQIRSFAQTMPSKDLARQFGVNIKVIYAVLERKTWAHLPDTHTS